MLGTKKKMEKNTPIVNNVLSLESFDTNKIIEIGKDLLDSPAITLDDGRSTGFYSKEQMIEMFRHGFSIFQKPYSYMRGMSINESALFPAESLHSVRVAASIIKREFGGEYKITRVLRNNKVVSVKVVRAA